MAGGKLHDLKPKESWTILKDLALYDNESLNDPRDFAKPVKAIALPQDVPRNPMAPKSIAAIDHNKREKLRKKGIKSPSKLLSPKYLSPASIKELNKNPTAPKRVHFVNSIIILSTNSDTEEEDISLANACNLNLGGMVKGREEVKEKGTKESELKTNSEADEVSEEEEDEFVTDKEVEEILKE
ncbi:hypothetical protein Tco_1434376 [Tanacetum coccineum]